ncbi:MAG: hypothetical protein H7232_17300 [Aeromicrobium sp.]|nr:hypothetical protein [Burkholderiales bacterium]
MADYSNKYFLTEGTNLGNLAGAFYSMPPRNRSAYGISDKSLGESYSSDSMLRLLTSPSLETNVQEAGQARRMYISTESIATDFSGRGPEYSMTRFNYDDQAELLLPKAAAYSAGMIDYFFRGKIDCVPDSTQSTQVNACLIKNLGTEPLSGIFEFFYDDVDGLRRPVPNSKVPVTNLEPSADASAGKPTSFDEPTNPAPKRVGTYILVFKGTMGNEAPGGATGGDASGPTNIGAVTGKIVTLRNSNALYLVGLDASSQRVYMRVDRAGTKVLSTSEFHPLRPLSISFFNGRPKSYLNKQIEFFNDGTAYRTRALTVGGTPLVNGTTTPRLTGYVFNDDAFDPKPGVDYASCSQLCWQADATLASGQYRYKFSLNVFSSGLNVFDGRLAEISYDRGTVVNGVSFVLDSGSVQLPPLPSGLTGLSYLGASKGELLVSPDGRSVVGFKGTTPDRQQKHYELRLTIGEAVAAQWVQTVTDPYAQSSSGSGTVTPAGTFTKTASRVCEGLESTVTGSLPLFRTFEMREASESQASTQFFDYQRGNLLSFRSETLSKAVGQADYLAVNGTLAVGYCRDVEWILDKISGYSLHFSEYTNKSFLLSGQSASDAASVFSRTGDYAPPFPEYGRPRGDNFIVDYEYFGPPGGWSMP